MIGKKILEDKGVTLPEVRYILMNRKKLGELTYEQNVTYDYVLKFGKTSLKDMEKALKELTDEGIDQRVAVKIVNVKPATPEEVKLIFERVRFDVKEDQIKKILSVVKKL